MDKKIKIALHIHSWASRDSLLTKQKIIDLAQNDKIDVLAICDHNEIFAAQELAREKNLRIIVGEEIETKEGEIIGLFLKHKIEPNLSFVETIDQIHNQNGLVYLVHPFDRLRKKTVNQKILDQIIPQIDIVEIFNSRTVFHSDDQKATIFADKHRLLKVCGSDAHSSIELNRALMTVDDFSDQKSFLESLQKGRLINHYSPIWVHPLSKFYKIFR